MGVFLYTRSVFLLNMWSLEGYGHRLAGRELTPCKIVELGRKIRKWLRSLNPCDIVDLGRKITDPKYEKKTKTACVSRRAPLNSFKSRIHKKCVPSRLNHTKVSRKIKFPQPA